MNLISLYYFVELAKELHVTNTTVFIKNGSMSTFSWSMKPLKKWKRCCLTENWIFLSALCITMRLN